MENCRRDIEPISSFRKPSPKEKRNRDLESVLGFQKVRERILSERRALHEFFQCVGQTRTSEVQSELDRRKEICRILMQIGMQFQFQRMDFCQANPPIDQISWSCDEFGLENRLFQTGHERKCRGSRRITQKLMTESWQSSTTDQVFRVQEVWWAAIFAYSLIHGCHWVHQDTFLKISLIKTNHHQYSSEKLKILATSSYRMKSIDASNCTESQNCTTPTRLFYVVELWCYFTSAYWKFRGTRSWNCISIKFLTHWISSVGVFLFRLFCSRSVVHHRSGGGEISGRHHDVMCRLKACVR